METLQPEAPPDPQHHARLYATLGLSPEQRRLLAGFYKIYAAEMEANLQHRHGILARVAELHGPGGGAAGGPPGPAALQALMAGRGTPGRGGGGPGRGTGRQGRGPRGQGPPSGAPGQAPGQGQQGPLLHPDQAASSDELAELTGQLHSNLMQMYRVTVHSTFFFFNKVLSIVQVRVPPQLGAARWRSGCELQAAGQLASARASA